MIEFEGIKRVLDRTDLLEIIELMLEKNQKAENALKQWIKDCYGEDDEELISLAQEDKLEEIKYDCRNLSRHLRKTNR